MWQRVSQCTTCGLTLDRDVNAACNIRAEGRRLQRNEPRPPGPGGVRDGRDPATHQGDGFGFEHVR
ncbi:MAG: transposase [Intrasporangiaceae bacterium]|nr:transposase [Intrasporangiaceae bacterium]